MKNKNLIYKLEWRWRVHDGYNYRVWRTDWAGDAFEIFTSGKFAELLEASKRLGIPIVEADDD